MRTVVAALLTRDAKLLVCQRRRDDTFPLLWEFPGGKVELGESPQEALARELREELGIEALIGDEVHRTRYHYGVLHEELLLVFFRARLQDSASLKNLVFETFEWSDLSALPRYEFLPADKELIDLVASHAIPLE
jgi:8-oxo-dGTP diphosphatase